MSDPAEKKPTRGAVALKSLRERLKLTLKEAADALGVKAPTVWEWESGKKVPRSLLRQRIELWSGGKVRASWWVGSVEKAERVETWVSGGKRVRLVPLTGTGG